MIVVARVSGHDRNNRVVSAVSSIRIALIGIGIYRRKSQSDERGLLAPAQGVRYANLVGSVRVESVEQVSVTPGGSAGAGTKVIIPAHIGHSGSNQRSTLIQLYCYTRKWSFARVLNPISIRFHPQAIPDLDGSHVAESFHIADTGGFAKETGIVGAREQFKGARARTGQVAEPRHPARANIERIVHRNGNLIGSRNEYQTAQRDFMMRAGVERSGRRVHILPVIFAAARSLRRRAACPAGGDASAGGVVFQHKSACHIAHAQNIARRCAFECGASRDRHRCNGVTGSKVVKVEGCGDSRGGIVNLAGLMTQAIHQTNEHIAIRVEFDIG